MYVCRKSQANSPNFPLLQWLDVPDKGKVHPRTGHEGPEGEYRYSSTLSLTLALDGSGWLTPRLCRFTPGKDPVPIVQEAGWATGPVWTGAENLVPTGIRLQDRRGRSESLYRLSYPGSVMCLIPKEIFLRRSMIKYTERGGWGAGKFKKFVNKKYAFPKEQQRFGFWVQSQDSPFGICGGLSGNGVVLCTSALIFSSQSIFRKYRVTIKEIDTFSVVLKRNY